MRKFQLHYNQEKKENPLFYGELWMKGEERLEPLSQPEAAALSEALAHMGKYDRFLIVWSDPIDWENLEVAGQKPLQVEIPENWHASPQYYIYVEDKDKFAPQFRLIWNSFEYVKVFSVKDEIWGVSLALDLEKKNWEKTEKEFSRIKRWRWGCLMIFAILFDALMILLRILFSPGFRKEISRIFPIDADQYPVEKTGFCAFPIGPDNYRYLGFYTSSKDALSLVMDSFKKRKLSIEANWTEDRF